MGRHCCPMLQLLLVPLVVTASQEPGLRPLQLQRPQSGNMGDLWLDCLEVTKLMDVFKRMKELEAEKDPRMLVVINYLKGNKSRAIAQWMWQDQGFIDLYKFLRNNGVDMDGIFSWLNEQLDYGEFHPPAAGAELKPSKHRSIKSLWDELVGIIPYADYLTWFLEQYAINPDMIKFVTKLEHSESVKDHLNSCPQYQAYRCWLIGEQVDLVEIETRFCTFLGWADCSTAPCGPYPTPVPSPPTSTEANTTRGH